MSCPICGRDNGILGVSHHCPESVLRAIDAANTRAEREEMEPQYERREFHRSLRQRLREGYELMALSGDQDALPKRTRS